MLLRYFEDVSAREIARREHLPVETVRTRIKRGLVLLRTRLASEFGAQDWRAAVTPLLFPLARRMPWTFAGTSGAKVLIMKKAVWIGLAVLLIASGGLLFGLWNMRPPEQAAPDAEPALVMTAPRSTEIFGEPTRVPDAAGQDGVLPPNAVATSGEHLRVLIEDGRTGKPVAGARVYVVDSGKAEHRLWVRSAPSLDEVLRVGEMWVSNAHGAIEHAMPRAPLYLGAVAKDLRGFASLSPGSEQHGRGRTFRLKLYPHNAIVLQVVDRDGRPCEGVPIELTSVGDCRWQRWPDDRTPDADKTSFAWSGTTRGKHGIAKAYIAPDLFEAKTKPCRLRASLKCAEGPASAVTFSLSDPPQPIRLVLPATGSVVLRLRKAEGGTYEAPASVRMAIASLSRPEHELWLTNDASRGQVLFPYVPLGCRLKFLGWDRVSGNWFAEASGTGPTRAGQRITINAVVARRTTITARLVWKDGTPVRTRTFRIQQFQPRRERGLGPVCTDSAGRFTYRLRSANGALLGRCKLVLILWENQDADERVLGPWASTIVSLPESGHPVFDLGDLLVHRLRPVLSGVAVDGDGNPLADVEITVGPAQSPGAQRTPATFPAGSFVRVHTDASLPTWVPAVWLDESTWCLELAAQDGGRLERPWIAVGGGSNVQLRFFRGPGPRWKRIVRADAKKIVIGARGCVPVRVLRDASHQRVVLRRGSVSR